MRFSALSGILLASTVAASLSTQAHSSNLGIEVVGGFYANDIIQPQGRGREHQARMSRVLVDFDFTKQGVDGLIEIAAFGDELSIDADNSNYESLYRNLGTDLYHYGDQPLRQAWLGQKKEHFHWQVGRVFSLMSLESHRDHFVNQPVAPNGVLYNTELLHGLRSGIEYGAFSAEVGALWGNGRSGYLQDPLIRHELDPATKGNNTPILESRVKMGLDEDIGHAFVAYRRNAVGSAVGDSTSGKMNDDRMALGVEMTMFRNEHLISTASGQWSRFATGLREDGVQGERTPDASLDIEKEGWFVSKSFYIPKWGLSARWTQEEMDRADNYVWREIADFDPEHPVMSASESRQILEITKDFGNGLKVSAFHRRDDVPYGRLNGDAIDGDQYGIFMSYRQQWRL